LNIIGLIPADRDHWHNQWVLVKRAKQHVAELAPPEAEEEYYSNVEHPEPQGLAYASPA